jgi:hypothetical protein
MRTVAMLGGVLLMAGLATPAAAQAKESDALVRKLKAPLSASWGRGMRPTGESLTGTLRAEASARFPLALSAGRTYAVVGLCDDACHDLDLRLFGPDGTEISSDVEPNERPVVLVVPRRAGTYQVRAYMAECRSEVCTFGIQLFVR